MKTFNKISLAVFLATSATFSCAEFGNDLGFHDDSTKSLSYYRKAASREKLLTDIARSKRERIQLGFKWNENDGTWVIRNISESKVITPRAITKSTDVDHSVDVGGLVFKGSPTYSDYKLLSVMNDTATISMNDGQLSIKEGQRLPSGELVSAVSVDMVKFITFDNEEVTLIMEL